MVGATCASKINLKPRTPPGTNNNNDFLFQQILRISKVKNDHIQYRNRTQLSAKNHSKQLTINEIKTWHPIGTSS
jgi:hypothetical protein